MRRREFITLIGSAVAAWPLAAYAQPKIARIGMPEDDPWGNTLILGRRWWFICPLVCRDGGQPRRVAKLCLLAKSISGAARATH
jgi:hypothetical protein